MRTTTELVAYLGLRPTGDLGPLTIYTAKNGRTVYFPKAPPEKPASQFQLRQRHRFRLVALLWRALTSEKRYAWLRAADRCSLYATGYNLFTYWHLTHDEPAIRTIERQSGLSLLD